MTATLDAPLTETPGVAIFDVDSEDGVTSFAWTMAPWDAFVELWISEDGEDRELLPTVARLPFMYDDGQETDVASLEMFAEGYQDAGVIGWTALIGPDQVMLACGIIQADIAAGIMTWDHDEQTLRVNIPQDQDQAD